jgi:hypothetical protein
MNKNIIYIVGATVLVGGAYLFLKNKKKQDTNTLAELSGTTSGGTTSGGTTGGTTSNSLSLCDDYPNLAKATVLVGQRGFLQGQINQNWADFTTFNIRKKPLKPQIEELDKKLATLGYKVDATGSLVKI